MLENECNEFLYVAHNFPPLVGGGVARTEQNCKMLPGFGWNPTLLVASADDSEQIDRKYAEMGVEVLRASGVVKENLVRGLPRTKGNKAPLKVQLMRRIAAWLLVPDRQVLWKFPAQQMALGASRKHNWKCVLGSTPPLSAAWIGMHMAKRLNLPFVLEYRDIIGERFKGGPPTALHRAAIRAIERSLVRAASKIIVVSPAMKDWVVQRHNLNSDMVTSIPTGFAPQEREVFRALPKTRNERFTMIYAGIFVRDRKPDTTLEAIRHLIDKKAVPADKIRVIFIGNLSPDALAEFGLQGVAETIPFIPHEEVIKYYAQSDLLLLICDKRQYQNVTYPGKLFEYIMTEKPVLGLMDKSSGTAKIIEESGTGLVADAYDVEEAASKIEHFYNLWAQDKPQINPNNEIIEQFNALKAVEGIASILTEVSAQ